MRNLSQPIWMNFQEKRKGREDHSIIKNLLQIFLFLEDIFYRETMRNVFLQKEDKNSFKLVWGGTGFPQGNHPGVHYTKSTTYFFTHGFYTPGPGPKRVCKSHV